MAINQHDLKAAQRYFEESQTRLRQLGDRRGLIRAVGGLAKVALEQKRYLEARALILEAITLTREVGDRWTASVMLDLMGSLSIQQRHTQLAAQLFGAAEGLREAIGAPLSPAFRDWRERDLSSLRAQLPSETFTRLWDEGRALAPEAAAQLFEAAKFGESTKPAPLGELTAREIEVLRLVSEGLTDAEIAERLVVSVRTVNAHLRSIYGKLDVTSRTAAARWGVENGLSMVR